jgi:hypothetical protein
MRKTNLMSLILINSCTQEFVGEIETASFVCLLRPGTTDR